MSHVQVNTWPNFGEISANIYEDNVFSPFFRSLPAVTLTFDLWSQKLVITTKPNTPMTKIGWNSLHWFLRYGVHKIFGTYWLTHALTHRRTELITECLLHRFSMVMNAQKQWNNHTTVTASQVYTHNMKYRITEHLLLQYSIKFLKSEHHIFRPIFITTCIPLSLQFIVPC